MKIECKHGKGCIDETPISGWYISWFVVDLLHGAFYLTFLFMIEPGVNFVGYYSHGPPMLNRMTKKSFAKSNNNF